MFVVMTNVVQLQKPDKKCRSKYELFIRVRKCDECFECGWKIFKTVSMVTMVYWPLNLFDLNLWGTRNTTIVTCIRWILVNMVRLNKDTEIEMSIAISNGQTKAVIMRINEFTQVTHDEREKKVSAHTRIHPRCGYQEWEREWGADEPNAAMSNIMLQWDLQSVVEINAQIFALNVCVCVCVCAK